MSSSTFWTEIRPDPVLRRRVLAAGVLLGLLGVPIILSLPLASLPAWLIVVAWLTCCGRELSLLVGAYRRCSGLRLASDGEVLVLGRDRARAATLLPGCLVLDEIAWLRLRDGSGRCWGELVAGNHRESEDWRRFQVILRHPQPC